MLNGTDVHAVLEKRIKEKAPAPIGEPFVQAFERQGAVEAEVALAVNHWLKPISFWGGNGIGHQTEPLIRGKFDVVITQGSSAIYADWKTGKPYENNELQFRIGALLLFAARPELQQVTGFNVWLKTGKLGQPYVFKRTETSPQWAALIKQMRTIEARDPKVEWEKQPGPLCKFCPVRSCVAYQGG